MRPPSCIDVLELGVPVGMLGALVRLAIVLAREAELHQFLLHGVSADRMSYTPSAFRRACPCSWRPRSAARIGSPRVAGSTSRLSSGMSPGSLATTALRPPPARRILPFGTDDAAFNSSSPRLIVERAIPVISATTLQRTVASRLNLGRGKQPTSALFELGAHRFPAQPYRICVDHSARGTSVRSSNGIPRRPSQKVTRPQIAIQLLFGAS